MIFKGILIYGFIKAVTLALVALGFNLTFGISGVANFAYGAIYVFAGYLSWLLLNKVAVVLLGAGGAVVWSILTGVVAVLVSAALGALLFRLILIRLRGMILSEVIATFAVGLAILETFRALGFIGHEFTLPKLFEGSFELMSIPVDYQDLMIVLIGAGLALFLYLFTRNTRMGLAFRGIAQDERTALSLGINSDKVAMYSVAFGAGYVAIAAVFILPRGLIGVNQGYSVLIDALAVCIVGGLGSTVGVIVASFLIGYAQIATQFLPFLGPHWMMIVSLIAILIILGVKPSGLFGKHKELEERI